MSANSNAIAAVTTMIYNPTEHNYFYACRTIRWSELAYLAWVKNLNLTPDTRLFTDLRVIVDVELAWNTHHQKTQNILG